MLMWMFFVNDSDHYPVPCKCGLPYVDSDIMQNYVIQNYPHPFCFGDINFMVNCWTINYEIFILNCCEIKLKKKEKKSIIFKLFAHVYIRNELFG